MLIKENELRHGSWINTPDGFRKVIGYSFGKVYVETTPPEISPSTAYFTYLISECSPIRLTKEILERLGFVYWELEPDCTDPADAYWVHRRMPYAINNLSWTVQKIKVKLRGLHHLQNLFLDFTHEEIIFNQ